MTSNEKQGEQIKRIHPSSTAYNVQGDGWLRGDVEDQDIIWRIYVKVLYWIHINWHKLTLPISKHTTNHLPQQDHISKCTLSFGVEIWCRLFLIPPLHYFPIGNIV